MRIRPYLKKDFEVLSNWITDQRSHALWCANLIPFPLEKKSFDDFLLQEEQYEDSPFVATTDDGKVVGFFCFSINLKTNEGKLKFIVIDHTVRNKGYGYEMLTLAVKYAVTIAKVDSVELNVFPENPGAKKCYEKVGFMERTFTENAFAFQNESWGRCNMVIKPHMVISKIEN